MQHLIKLKIWLKFSLFLFLFSFNSYTTNLDENITKLEGTVLHIDNTNYTKITLRSTEKVLVHFYDEIDLAIGDKIKVHGRLEKPEQARVFNLFNYQNYLKSKKIFWILKADKIEIKEKNNNIFYTLKTKVKKRINTIEKSRDYVSNFIMGENNLDENVLESYKTNGTLHLLAVSGAHIAILILIMKKTIKKDLPIILVLLFYLFLTGFRTSITRAIIFYIMLLINKKLNLKQKPINLLIILASFLLIINPYLIYDIGFQFSFIISFFLLKTQHIINKNNNFLKKLLITSTIAFIVSLPITINNFFQINILTPLINIIFVPIYTFIIYPVSLLTFFLPFLDNLFFHIISLTEKLSIFLANFSINFIIKKPNIILFLIYYILIYICIKKRKALLILIALIILNNNIHLLSNKSIITVIDVKQGDSILIESKNREKIILIDTGGIFNRERKTFLAKNTIIPYLKSRGISKIDILVLTHGHHDHIGEAIDLIKNFKVKEVFLNSGSTNKQEKRIIEFLKKEKINYKKISEKELQYKNFSLHFINQKNKNNENEDSLVLYTVLNNKKLLFMGDAGFESEQYIMNNYNLNNIDILKIGHHGSKYSTSNNFLKQINPTYGIIQSGINNRFNHPHEELIKRLEKHNVSFFNTSSVGSVRFTIKNNIFVEKKGNFN